MTEITRSELEQNAREYISKVQRVAGSKPTASQQDIDKAIQQVASATARFVRARGGRVRGA